MTTIDAAAPIARRDDGLIITIDGVRCENAEAAIQLAKQLLANAELHRGLGIQRDRQSHVWI